ncbi:MAG TPA: cobalamin-independent methionine synthase II family protein [Streptosporangiaceae bacterium]|jgi:5-methyltetrahydropteroyltriglutamate--homocysteine methyltransferase
MPSTPRAEHIGSLLRPAELLAARTAHAAGELDVADLRTAEDRAIEQALTLQQETGLDVYSDGEYRRFSFLSDVADAVDGFVDGHATMDWQGGDSALDKRSTAKIVGARLRQHRRLTAHEVPFLAAHAPRPYKMTLPDPTYFTLASWQRGTSETAYPSRADLLGDLTDVVRSELAALIADGVPYIQLDAPGFTLFADERLRAQMSADGTDPDALLDACIEADRACLAGLDRAGVTVAMHLCRGNSQGRWLAAGGYDRIAAELFARVPVDTWLLEYDDERSGDFAPLRHMPDAVIVVLGLVSTKTGHMEKRDELIRRVEQAVRYVPLDRLALSPQCGFASVAMGNPIDWDIQRDKLRLVADTARDLWG